MRMNTEPESPEDHVIYSPKHSRGIAMWWRPKAAGYTQCVDAAGRYTEQEAKAIERESHADAVAVPVSFLEDLTMHRIVDSGFAWNGTTLKAWADAALAARQKGASK